MATTEETAARKRKRGTEATTWTVERVLLWISIVFCLFTVLYYSWRMPALGIIFTGITLFGILPMALGDRIRKKQ